MPYHRIARFTPAQFSALTLLSSLTLLGSTPPVTAAPVAPGAIPKQQEAVSPAVAAALKEIGELFKQGMDALNKRDYPRAEQFFRTAYEKSETLGDRYSMGVMLDALSGVYATRGDMRQAIPLKTKAIEFLRQADDKKALARGLNNLGDAYRTVGQYEKAASALEEAVGIWHGMGDAPGAAWGLLTLGEIYKSAGHFEKAIITFQQGLRIREETNAGPRAIALAHNDLGRAYFDLARFTEAHREYEIALQLARTANSPDIYAMALSNSGATFLAEGRLAEAMDAHQKALALREKGENPEEVASSLANLCSVCYHEGRFDWAIFYARRAMDIAQKTGSKPLIARQNMNIGMTLDALGQRRKAADSYLQALVLFEEIGDPNGLADVAFSLGNLRLSTGDPAGAVALYERVLPLAQKRNDTEFVADIQGALGSALDALGRRDQTLPLLLAAHREYEKRGNLQRLAQSFNNLGAVYSKLGRTEEATQAYSQALTLKLRFGNPMNTATSQANLAAMYVQQNQWEKAADLFKQAVANAEIVRDQIAAPSEIGTLQSSGSLNGEIYARYAGVLAHLGKADEALAQVERGRGQGLARQAIQGKTTWGGILPPGDARKLADATKALRQADAALRSATERAERMESEEADPESVQASQRTAKEARRVQEETQQALTSVRNDIAARRPAYRSLCGLDAPTPAQFLALAKAHPDTLYLTWSVAPEGAQLLALRDGVGVKAFPVSLTRRALTAQISEWRDEITPEEGGPGTDLQREEKTARTLYDVLLGPAEKAGLFAAPEVKRLVLIGDGPLREMPFAALVAPDGKRLIERFPLSTGIALRLLTLPSAGDGAEVVPRPVGRGILCVADPGGGDARRGDSDLLSGFAPLPAARREGQAVAQLFGDGATLLIGDAATQEAVLPRLETARLLHFATHGYLDDRDGLRSGLLLAPTPQQKDAEGEPTELPLLTAGEILQHPIAAEIAVLSACETGRGERSGGEGLLGLVWALRAAGCPSVIASQWSVDDSATGKLMVRFYEGLRAGKRRDEALQEAMRTVRSDPSGKTSAPFYWAAFQLHGETGVLGQ